MVIPPAMLAIVLTTSFQKSSTDKKSHCCKSSLQQLLCSVCGAKSKDIYKTHTMGTADELLLSNSCCGCVKLCVVLVVVVLSYLWWNFGGIDDGSMDKATEDYLAGSVTVPAPCQVCSLI
jgi:hypothetical protein